MKIEDNNRNILHTLKKIQCVILDIKFNIPTSEDITNDDKYRKKIIDYVGI